MQRKYTGRDHIEASFRREFTDRVPVRVWYGLELENDMEFLRVTRKEVRTQSDKYALVITKLHEMIPSDTVAVAAFDVVMFAEGAGSGLGLTPKEVVEIARRGSVILEEKSTFAKCNLPDLMQGTRLPYYVEACKIVVSEIDDAMVDVIIVGPWTTAAMMRSATSLIYDTMDDPRFVRDLMRHATEYTKMVGLAIAETGIGVITIGDPSSGTSVISPKMFQEWSKPYLEESIKYLKQKTSAKICLHICGKVDPIMEDLVVTGVDAISIDGPSSLKRMLDVSQGRVVVIGNVATEIFVNGTKEQIEEAVKECIDIAAPGGAYILSSGCGVPGTMENVRHFLEFGRQYGHYRKAS